MITDQAVSLLASGNTMTDAELASHIPSLAGQPFNADIVRLLLRLDRRFKEHEGRWMLSEGVSDPSHQIREAVQAYFKNHRFGELLKHLVPIIAAQTGQPSNEVENVIRLTYRSAGGMILNQPKERE